MGAATSDEPPPPSRAEINELLDKAEQKVSAYEEAVKLAKPKLDMGNEKLFDRDADASSGAHQVIAAVRKKGPSAYGLMLLISILDDLSLAAATDGMVISQVSLAACRAGIRDDSDVTALINAGTSLHDISELILHASLRFIFVEERLMINKQLLHQ